jgi:type IV fimbrial biogenesis protein FimT
MSSKTQGFTFIELMTAVAVLSVLVATGLPSFAGYLEKNRLKSAAETLAADMHYARSEAILRGAGANVNLSFTTDSGTAWCYGMTIDASCDCTVTDITDTDACVIPTAGIDVLKVVNSTDFQTDVSMTSVTFTGSTAGFSSTRNLGASGAVSLQATGRQIDVSLTSLGRVRVCSDSDLGYESC